MSSDIEFVYENTARKSCVVMRYCDFSKFSRFAVVGTVLIMLMFEIIPSGAIWIVLTQDMTQLFKNYGDTDDYSPSAYLKPSYVQMTTPRYYGIYFLFHSSTKEANKKITSLNKKRFLIVDDGADITFALRKALTDNGFKQVDTFNDPLIALEHFKAGLYDLVILDVIMPQMDGFEVFEEMKTIDNEIRVCFITAFEVNYQALRRVSPTMTSTDDLGCFIRKPIEVQQLLLHIKEELDQTKV